MKEKSSPQPHAKQIIAVIGTGRSGTHLLGYLLDTADDTTTSIEDGELFPRITKAAVHGYSIDDILYIKQTLRSRLDECTTAFYVEKSHPLLWLAAIPEIRELPIKFIGIRRDPYEVVASMLEHAGTRSWCENWKRLPQPNIFLGINQQNVREYDRMTIAQRCVLRWASHMRELDRLTYILGTSHFFLIDFKDLIADKTTVIGQIKAFTGIHGIDDRFEINADTLDKWKARLTAAQVREIATTLSSLPECNSTRGS